ncbi:MAG: PilT/PilU family type 4a pilus ATPase [bacterium]|nr:PilT/PilU family type 4a pilus ATPase [Candidatus Sumerlaeota bacterium]
MDIAALVEGAVQYKASDIHLMEGSPPYFRLDGDLIPVDLAPVSHEDMEGIMKEIVPERLFAQLAARRAIDMGYQHKDIVRLRVIIYYERGKLRMVLRLIPLRIKTFEELNLPDMLKRIADFISGIVLVTGPTGSGKSTTLAAIIDFMNARDKISITTIEDPIEFVHPNKTGIVTQREVGEDVTDFNSGVIQALRQDPDVILIGEMRDTETIRTALKAAETGHYVLSTLHTSNAVQTIERTISTFPQAEQDLVREQIATNLKASITQTLVKRVEGGRVAALEILIVTPSVEKLISENRLRDIFTVMQTGEEGMQTCDQALANLAREKIITAEEGAANARDVYAFKRFFKGIVSSSDRGGIIAGFGG